MNRGMQLMLGGVVVASLGAGTAAFYFHNKTKADAPGSTAKLTRGELEVVLAETGSIEPLTKVEVKSQVAGQVSKLLVDAGDKVSKGQLLIQLDTTDMQRQRAQAEADRDKAKAELRKLIAGARPEELEQARAALTKAQATLERARRDYQRSLEAVKTQTITQADADQAHGAYQEAQASLADAKAHLDLTRAGSREEDVAEARAELRRAEATLRNADDQIAYASIRAPMSGTVIKRGIEVGEMVSPGVSATAQGTSMLTVADLDHLIIKSNLNQIDVGKVRLDQAVDVRVDSAPGKPFGGRIHKVAPAAADKDANNIQTFPVETMLDVAASAGAGVHDMLKPGMSADVDVHVAKKAGALYLPVEAVVRGKADEGTVTLPAPKGGKPETRKVTIGLANDHQVEILSGLTEGQEVLIKPASSADSTAKM